MKCFKKSEDPMGDYVNLDGTRYSIVIARRIRSTDGVNVGYREFSSLQDALLAWKLNRIEKEGEV